MDAQLEGDLAERCIWERSVDGQDDRILRACDRDEAVANGKLAGQNTNRAERSAHDLLARCGKQAIHRRAVRIHRVLGEVAQLEQHRVEIATSHHLLLDRCLQLLDGKRLIADQE